MLTYHYALITDPCERTVAAFLEFARAHPDRLLTLGPEDARAVRCAIASVRRDVDRQLALGDENLTPALDGCALN